MAHSIQAMRTVFDVVKAARDNNNAFSDEDIQRLLQAIVPDENTRKRYDNFSKGYYSEELFRRIYSLLPWIRLITPLGQEQFPEKSKEEMQVPDFEIMYEVGSSDNIKKILVEAKLVDGDKQTFELLKHTYNVLKKYEDNSESPLLFAIFWRKQMIWTVNSIESFSEKSSSYKISFKNACKSDVSAIFGDYTYLFRKRPLRKSKFSNGELLQCNYSHSHEKYGRTLYEGISLNGKNFDDLGALETPVLDCAFDFKEIESFKINEFETELTEQLADVKYAYRLSSLMLGYLLKIHCYNYNDMYCQEHNIVENTFGIVDTVRRKMGGEKFYLLPYDKKISIKKLINLQFGNVPRIYKAYIETNRKEGYGILCSHD
ncbi:hypothetical protein [Propionispora hippei]|uniref:Uncharacterized protein n=1 Tax=Propionispora hippei DSM 15287 TaxID=1123003 RepID=A0A1M6GQ76_9FIRM|nr:hypothetical protein [Propionispora hippei]SHJ12042.1 hypothetical protein SAMN02745170_01780 [Propionispora hippei DSM 15287]